MISEAATKQAAKAQQKQKTPLPKQTASRQIPQKATPAKTTALSESLSEFKTSFLEFREGLMGALQRCSQQKKGASALAGLTVGPKASATTSSASAPNLDRTLGLHVSAAAQHAEVTMPLEEDGFISKRTASGNSYGSLEPYIDTWNPATWPRLAPTQSRTQLDQARWRGGCMRSGILLSI